MNAVSKTERLNARLTGVAETLLIPLWARAMETARPDGVIRDPYAVRILRELEYDFSNFEDGWKSQLGIAIRTWILDREVAQYLARRPDGLVVILGCGLDARSRRLDNGRASWIDLDLPDVIAVRERLIPPVERRETIAVSVTDLGWLDKISTKVPPLFVAEGLFMYLPETELKALLRALAKRFPDAEILIEALSRKRAGMTRRHDLVSKLGASFVWGIDSGREMEAWDSAIEFLREWPYFDFQRRRWRWLRLLRWLPTARKAIKIMHLRFRNAA
jgi:O-methyltransferase involved in polyketide biosynthesis